MSTWIRRWMYVGVLAGGVSLVPGCDRNKPASRMGREAAGEVKGSGGAGDAAARGTGTASGPAPGESLHGADADRSGAPAGSWAPGRQLGGAPGTDQGEVSGRGTGPVRSGASRGRALGRGTGATPPAELQPLDPSTAITQSPGSVGYLTEPRASSGLGGDDEHEEVEVRGGSGTSGATGLGNTHPGTQSSVARGHTATSTGVSHGGMARPGQSPRKESPVPQRTNRPLSPDR